MFGWLQRITSPDGANFTVGKQYANQFGGLFDDLAMSGYRVKPEQSGGYNPRTIAGTNTPSKHAYGAAVDVNWNENARGTNGNIDPEYARALAAKHGMTWGGDWNNPDPMHFEVSGRAPQLPKLDLIKPDGSNARFGGNTPMRDYQWSDALPMEEDGTVLPPAARMAVGARQPQSQQQQREPNIFESLYGRTMNPMFQGGLGLFLSASQGGDLNSGLNSGVTRSQAMTKQWQESQAYREREANKAAVARLFETNPSVFGQLPPALLEISKATRDPSILTNYVLKSINDGRTSDIKEYEYARSRGFQGSLQDWLVNKSAKTGEYNKTPVYGTRIGPDGQPQTVMLQTGSRGDAVETKLPDGVKVGAQKPIEIDAGTHTLLLDPITRQPIGQVPKNSGEVERQKILGKSQGEAQADLPRVKSNAENVFKYIDGVLNDPYLDNMIGWKGYTPNVSPQARSLQSKINQLAGQAFLIAFQSLKGAGAITETEGAKASESLARFKEMVQSGEDYRQALQDFRDEVQRLVDVAKEKAQTGPGKSGTGWSIQRVQ